MMTNKNESSFEAKIEKIEKLINDLQSSKVGIDASLLILEEAQNLAIECNKILSDAELKFSELKDKFSSNDNVENLSYENGMVHIGWRRGIIRII